MGAPADVEKARIAIENDFGVKAIYSPADMGEPLSQGAARLIAESS
jgi:3-hydroxybutyrate dehydrogenase